ncbi:hypothetical protein ACN38_g1657 [Penicillium nordicum]|uniref:Uncharacterized protein n=1 Tax=Penicillium nordicum TaxID=229535 RepID=A0A0M9WJL0_9EURO|nr:hypothetical protein ACN38_g1657 [Penicillium nordicum]
MCVDIKSEGYPIESHDIGIYKFGSELKDYSFLKEHSKWVLEPIKYLGASTGDSVSDKFEEKASIKNGPCHFEMDIVKIVEMKGNRPSRDKERILMYK